MPNQETNVKTLRINRLTNEQYDTAVKSDTELYLTPDTTDQDIANAISAHNTNSLAHSTLFNNKQDKLSTQTAYTSKGSATKVPQITTNTLGQVTGITEVTITQPTVNNANLVIQKNGTNVSTFSANASANVTCNITVPTKTSELTNNSGFITGITANNVTTALGYTPYNSSNPSGYITGITANNVTTALGYTPYNSTNPNGYTSNTGTVKSVRVQAGTGLASSTSTAQNTTLNTTISIASGYKLPTTTEWSGKQDALPAQSGQSGKFLTTDGSTLSWATVSTGTSDYSSLTNKPSINSVTLSGNKTSSDLGLQPALATQTVYTSKGSATKVPQITTNNLGQVTSITEVTITQPTVNNATLSIQKNGTTVSTFRANSSSNVTCNITVPTTVAELSDSSDYIQTSDLVELAAVATSGSYNDLTDKPTIPQGTVTSVRVQAASPVVSSTNTSQSTSLNTTISLADGYGDTKNPYASKTKNYVLAAPSTANGAPTFRALTKADIPLASETAVSGGTTTSLVTTGEKYTWNNKQNALPSQSGQSGKFLTTNGSTMSWADASIEIDNSTITKNGSNQIQAVGVKDVRSSNTVKTWTGTRAQYNAIVTKDANTLYNITDDTDTTAAMLELLYPVGAVYIGTMTTCPLATLGIGSWEKIAEDQVLQGSSLNHNAGTTIAAGLPNITGDYWNVAGRNSVESGAIEYVNSEEKAGLGSGSSIGYGMIYLDASKANSIYGNSNTVQPPAFVVNIWRRIS